MFSIILSVAVILLCLAMIPVSAEKSSSIVRIYSRGVLPYETDVLLPYSIIQKLYHQQQQHLLRQGRHNSGSAITTKIRAVIRPRSEIKLPFTAYTNQYRQSRKFLSPAVTRKPLAKHLHFEKDHLNTRNFKLYDDDGEHLLDLKYTDNVGGGGGSIQPSIANITTTPIKDVTSAFSMKHNYHLGNVNSPKKLVKHVWINLK